MIDTPENPFAMAERHVAESEVRVLRQREILDELEKDGHVEAAEKARTLLQTFEVTLDVMREHLRIEREAHGR